MARKRYSAEQIIKKLREAEVLQAQGQTIAQVVRQLAVTDQTYLPRSASSETGLPSTSLTAKSGAGLPGRVQSAAADRGTSESVRSSTEIRMS